MLTICRKFHFDAAHHLPYYEGKCHKMHGHRWYVEIELAGPIHVRGEKEGMIFDFHDMKDYVEEVIGPLDHSILNERVFNPTAENITLYIRENLSERLNVIRIRVYESEDSYAEWRKQ
jgi:6-pyruvoyltetrahydropterin/6-carboxytetrahydropterin synthase